MTHRGLNKSDKDSTPASVGGGGSVCRSRRNTGGIIRIIHTNAGTGTADAVPVFYVRKNDEKYV